MQYLPLGNSDISVSQLCLGTMTYGRQNTAQQAHSQLDFAAQHGINFIDTAELYPAPVSADTGPLTETIVGQWLQKQKRDQFIIATKVVGPAPKKWIGHIRGGPQLNDQQIEQALNDSLQRLHTDYIDLYQIHWPARNTNFFGKLGYSVGKDKHDSPIIDTLATLARLQKSGKIRHIGVSNETPWGLHQYQTAAKALGVEKIVSIQNPYCLLNRTFEIGLAEFSHREHIGLLAYSPLAGGALSGKYLHAQQLDNARLTLYKDYFYKYTTESAVRAVESYVNVAQQHGYDPAHMALAFVRQQPFVNATIIGATDCRQLKTNIDSVDVTLNDECLKDIQKLHQQQPNPCP